VAATSETVGTPGQDVDPRRPAADWKQQMNRWDRFHYVRVAVIIAAFALLVAALT
jgi:uncharacterized membrane protein